MRRLTKPIVTPFEKRPFANGAFGSRGQSWKFKKVCFYKVIPWKFKRFKFDLYISRTIGGIEPHLKALMCCFLDLDWLGRCNTFTLCHALLKTAVLHYKKAMGLLLLSSCVISKCFLQIRIAIKSPKVILHYTFSHTNCFLPKSI